MPLLPIDLQTLFAQMDHVGKEQAIQKNISPLHQSLQGSEIVKQTDEKDKSVNEAKEVSDGAEKIKDKNAERKEKESSKEQKKKEEKSSKKGVFNDPDLGQHIDIVG